MELEKMAASKSELESQLKEKTMRLSELEAHVLTLRRGHDGVDEGHVSSKSENRRSEDDVAVFKVRIYLCCRFVQHLYGSASWVLNVKH